MAGRRHECEINNMDSTEVVTGETNSAKASAETNDAVISSNERHENVNALNDQDQQEEEGEHAQLLRNALDRTLTKCISSAKLSHFARAYSSVYKKEKKAVSYVHEKFKENLGNMLQMEIETLFDEENIVAVMNGLDELIANTSEEKQTWRPSGSPSADLRSHLVPVKLCQKAKLEKLLMETEARGRQWEAKVKQRQQALTAAAGKLKKHESDLREASKQGEEVLKLIQNYMETHTNQLPVDV